MKRLKQIKLANMKNFINYFVAETDSLQDALKRVAVIFIISAVFISLIIALGGN